MKKEERWHQFLSSAVEQSSEGMAIADLEGNLMYVNPAWAEMHDYDSSEELIGRSLKIFHNQEQIEKDVAPFNLIVKEKGANAGEVGHIRIDGTPFPTLMTTTLLNDDNGKPEAILGIAKDISVIKETEKALRESENNYRTLLNNIPGMVYRGNHDWSVETVKGVEDLCGFTRDELNSMKDGWINIIHPDDRDKVFEEASDSFEGIQKVFIQTYRIITKGGEILWVEDHKVSVFSEEGKFIGVDGIIFDITSRRQIEIERQKLEAHALAKAHLVSLGEIATGIAHELNQPLSYIKVVYEAAIDDLEKGQLNQEELQEDFPEALRQVARITRIIDHLRIFGRSNSKEFFNVNMESILDKALILMSERIRLQNITLNRYIADDLKDIYGNAGQLEQIFINLFLNSMDVLQGKKDGIINISMNNKKDKVVVCFFDNGTGIPKELLNKVFEPFFTTKETGKGTGLGLSIVYGIVKDHSGTISCESESNQGATFVISFPQLGKS